MSICIEFFRHCCPTDAASVSSKDHSLFYHLSTFLAILRNCDVARSKKFKDQLCAIYDLVRDLLLHPHAWVRLICCQIFGVLFSAYQPSEIASDDTGAGYFNNADDADKKLKMLSHCFCDQLEPDDALSEELTQQVVKNLTFVVKVFDARDKTPGAPVHPHVLKILKRMNAIAKSEQAGAPRETRKRSAVLKFCATVALSLKSPERVLRLLLDPVYRGVSASATHGQNEPRSVEDLRSLAAEVQEVIKGKVDVDAFARAYLHVTKKIAHKRKERKQDKALQLVADPQKAAAHKIRKQERTKQQRKRKLAKLRPEYALSQKRKRT